VIALRSARVTASFWPGPTTSGLHAETDFLSACRHACFVPLADMLLQRSNLMRSSLKRGPRLAFASERRKKSKALRCLTGIRPRCERQSDQGGRRRRRHLRLRCRVSRSPAVGLGLCDSRSRSGPSPTSPEFPPRNPALAKPQAAARAIAGLLLSQVVAHFDRDRQHPEKQACRLIVG